MEKEIKSFRDLRVWQKRIEMVKDVYKATQPFPREETYGITNQIRRAAVSIPSNIAEGHIRQHRAEFRQFLNIALGSLAELETQITISKELNYLSLERANGIINQIDGLGKMIRSLLKKLSNLRSQTLTNP